MKSKAKQVKIVYLLDTSIQMERCKYKELNSYLERIKADGTKLVSSYFVLYEFKTCLMRAIMDFYFLVKTYNDVSVAFTAWSEKFGKRDLKNILILAGVLFNIYDTIKTKDVKNCLKKIQAIIFIMSNNFYTYIDSMTGDFQNDEIIKLNIRTEEEYKTFIDAYNKRKIIPLNDFWDRHKPELELLLKDVKFKASKKYSKVYSHLEEINKDVRGANTFNCNKAVGDSVISADCPRKDTMLSLDESFSFLCPPLEKKYKILNKSEYGSKT